MLVTAVIRKVNRLFGESSSSYIMINEQDILDWIDEAQLKIVRETHCLTKNATAAASTYPLALPVDWVVTKRLTYNSVPLQMIDIDDIDALKIDTTSPVDSPSFYYVFAKTIRLYPNKGATDTNIVSHDYVCLPTVVATNATALDVPVSYHEDIVRFCVMRAHERNENWNAVSVSAGIFEGMSGLRKDEATLQDDDYYVVRSDPGEDW